MQYLSVCSGIEAATVAWQTLGWSAYGFSEIEKFPSNLLQHYYDVPNFGDMNDFKKWPVADVDVLVGGTPCQSFSVAGLREGLADPRGNLALVFCALLSRYRPRRFVWENVPGVLSSGAGRDFGALVGAMVKLGYGVAWRVLDAQYFGVPQRRRRVFVVGYLGDWRRAAEVLFEPESLRRDPPPRQESGQGTATGPAKSLAASGGGIDREDRHTLIPDIVGQAMSAKWAKGTRGPAGDEGSRRVEGVRQGMCVRRLTPLECERLQGFPDHYTNIPGASDSARYKALGNSMAVPVMRWIGQRITDQTRQNE